MAVPLLRAGTPIGAIGLGRSTPGAFSAAPVELLKTFAQQAVIAIGSAETSHFADAAAPTFKEKSLEYQTATSEVLKVMSRSTFDLQPVLDTLIVTALKLCNAGETEEYGKDGEVFRHSASHGSVPAYRKIEEQTEIGAGSGTLVDGSHWSARRF